MSTLHDTTDHIDDLALELLPLYSTCTALRTIYKPARLLIPNSVRKTIWWELKGGVEKRENCCQLLMCFFCRYDGIRSAESGTSNCRRVDGLGQRSIMLHDYRGCGRGFGSVFLNLQHPPRALWFLGSQLDL